MSDPQRTAGYGRSTATLAAVTDEPPSQTEQAPADVRDHATAAEQAYEHDDLQACFDRLGLALNLAERDGSPRGISTGLVVDLTLELFAEGDPEAARELFDRWWSLAEAQGPPSELADPEDRSLPQLVRELASLSSTFPSDIASVIASGLLQDEHGEDLERIALLTRMRPDETGIAATELRGSAPGLFEIYGETLGGRGAPSLEARSPPTKIIWFAALLALAALRAGLRSSCDGSAGEDASYERGRD